MRGRLKCTAAPLTQATDKIVAFYYIPLVLSMVAAWNHAKCAAHFGPPHAHSGTPPAQAHTFHACRPTTQSQAQSCMHSTQPLIRSAEAMHRAGSQHFTGLAVHRRSPGERKAKQTGVNLCAP